MRSLRPDEDSFTILSDAGDVIGGAVVIERRRVEVAPAGAYRGFDPLPMSISPEVQAFAEAEARRLGMLDE